MGSEKAIARTAGGGKNRFGGGAFRVVPARLLRKAAKQPRGLRPEFAAGFPV
jgi:hypothetical protein